MRVANQYDPNNDSTKKQVTNNSQKKEEPLDNLQDDNQTIFKDNPVQNSSLQNGEVTNFYFQKLIHIEYQLSLVVLVNIFLIIISSSLTFPQILPQYQAVVNACLYFCIICFITQCILVSFRMITCLQLQKQQRILYTKSTIFSSKKILSFLGECIILMVQPYPFFIGQHFLTQNSYRNINFYFPINDLLTIFSVFRIYILIRAALMLSPYKANRSNRLCKMYGCQADFAFSLKCLFKDNPLILIFIFFFTSSLIFSFQIYLAERYAFLANKDYYSLGLNTICNDFLNSFWLILMTITTVGYGDYFPQTPLGRMIILVVAVWGTFIVSIMVVVVSNTLSMQKNEKRTSIIVNKLQLRSQIQQYARKVIGYRILYHRHKKILNSNSSQEMKSKVLQLKSKCNKYLKQFSKLRKQLKLIMDYEDIQDEVSSHFLIINNDIQILNKNQQNIINFIHQNLEYQVNSQKNNKDSFDNEQKDDQQNISQKQQQETQKEEFQNFKNDLKQKKEIKHNQSQRFIVKSHQSQNMIVKSQQSQNMIAKLHQSQNMIVNSNQNQNIAINGKNSQKENSQILTFRKQT